MVLAIVKLKMFNTLNLKRKKKKLSVILRHVSSLIIILIVSHLLVKIDSSDFVKSINA